MNKQEILHHLINDEFPNGIAEIICDISCNGKVCYPNESILVVIDNNDYQDFIGKHWTKCNSINDFNEGIVYGVEEARKHYCRYYVSNFKEIKPFNK